MAASIDWTDDTIARLRTLWDEGHSTAEIGRRMGTTKNAIVGKAHRLELPWRKSPIIRSGPSPSGRQPRAARPSLPPLPSAPARPAPPPPAPPPAPPAPALPPRRRYGPSGQPCCWPLGEPGRPGFRFCDEGTAPGKPYCPEHAGLAYLPRPARQAATA